MILASLGGSGYLMLAIGKSTAVRYAGVFLAALIFPVVTNLFPWCLNNQRSDTKRGVGMVMFQLIGQCGTILGTRLYPAHEGPYYVKVSFRFDSFQFLVRLHERRNVDSTLPGIKLFDHETDYLTGNVCLRIIHVLRGVARPDAPHVAPLRE